MIVPIWLMFSLSIFTFYIPTDGCEKITLSISILIGQTVFLTLIAKRVPETSIDIPLLGLGSHWKPTEVRRSGPSGEPCKRCIFAFYNVDGNIFSLGIGSYLQYLFSIDQNSSTTTVYARLEFVTYANKVFCLTLENLLDHQNVLFKYFSYVKIWKVLFINHIGYMIKRDCWK